MKKFLTITFETLVVFAIMWYCIAASGTLMDLMSDMISMFDIEDVHVITFMMGISFTIACVLHTLAEIAADVIEAAMIKAKRFYKQFTKKVSKKAATK